MPQDSNNVPTADLKFRFGGILEVPVVSKVQRAVLDAGRLRGLGRALPSPAPGVVLDVGCGLGEAGRLFSGLYCGMDNSLPRVRYAVARYPACRFVAGNAQALPFGNGTFDLAMLVDTSHHLLDDQFLGVLEEMKRVSRRYLLVSDPVTSGSQSRLSRFFYRMDRGACFRDVPAMRRLLEERSGLVLVRQHLFRTFPGLYLHAAFVCRKS